MKHHQTVKQRYYWSTIVSCRSSFDDRRPMTVRRSWTSSVDGRPFRKSSFEDRQSQMDDRQLSIVGRRSSVVGRRSSVDDRQVVGRRSTIVDRRTSTNNSLQQIVGHHWPFTSDVRWIFTFQNPIRCCCHVIHKIPIVDNKISDGIKCRLAVS